MSEWYERGIFYHMYPLGMTGAPKENRESGTAHRFDELIRWIPYIADMGFNSIYIGPLFESGSHGYDTRDYRTVDRRLGTNADFKAFVEHCHGHGIRVVVDGVFNHTGREFFAFRDIQENREASPYRDWYRGVNFGWTSPMGDPFGYEAWQGHFSLPCLNLSSPDVKNYLFDTVWFWVDTFDIDGIRLDCANVLDFQFMRELRQVTAVMKANFWLMGEVIHGEYGRWVNGGMLHSVTNYELHKSIYSGLNDHNFFEIAHNVRRLQAIGRDLYTFLDNHDEDRIASKLKKREHLPLAFLLLFTLPGIPSVYYGSEWGIEGQRSRTSDEALRPAVSVKEAKEHENELTALVRTLAHIHGEQKAFHGGVYTELFLTNRQYAFSRQLEGETVIIAANSDDSEAELTLPIPEHPAEIPVMTDLLTGERYPAENGRLTLKIKGNSGVVLKMAEG